MGGMIAADKRMMREMIVAVLAVGIVLIWLNAHGLSGRRGVENPQTVAVARLQDSLDLWRANNVHGKILLLFDRHIPVDPLTYQDFELKPGEISPADALALLALIEARFDVRPGRHSGNNIEDLNQILHNPRLSRIWQARFTLTPPENARRLIRITSGYQQPFENMYFNEQRNVVLLNRLLLQTSFPHAMPVMTPMPAKERTYIRSAIKAGIVRKVIHVISDRSWGAVCKNLEDLQTVRPSGAGFRIVTFGGTPVQIIRLQDLQKLDERVLVNIDSKYWAQEELNQVHTLLRNGSIQADCVATSSTEPQDGEGE